MNKLEGDLFNRIFAPLFTITILQMNTQIQGTVKFFNEEKGFGFIKHENSSQETFVHANGLIDQIEANDKVGFRRAGRS